MEYQLNSSATWEAVGQLRRQYPHLPADYLEFLLRSDGGEGFVGISPGYFQLCRAQEVAQLTSDYELAKYCPGYVAIGSSGGGEVYVFSESGSPRGLFMVPAIGMEPATLRLVTQKFTDFVSLLRLWAQNVPLSPDGAAIQTAKSRSISANSS